MPSAKEGVRSNFEARLTERFSQEAERHDDRAGIENSALDLHRQMDTKSFVFAEREALSTRAVASPYRERLRMLTRTLRHLESAGLIVRRVTGTKAVAVEYSLTRLGRTLIAPLKGMCRWSRRHGKQVSAEVRLMEA